MQKIKQIWLIFRDMGYIIIFLQRHNMTEIKRVVFNPQILVINRQQQKYQYAANEQTLWVSSCKDFDFLIIFQQHLMFPYVEREWLNQTQSVCKIRITAEIQTICFFISLLLHDTALSNGVYCKYRQEKVPIDKILCRTFSLAIRYSCLRHFQSQDTARSDKNL